MKKNIVLYLSGFSKSGGKERVVANLLSEWKNRYNVTLIVKDNESSFYTIPDEVKLICMNAPYMRSMFDLKINRYYRMCQMFINYLYSIYELKKILKKIDYDYIYVTTPLNAYEVFRACPTNVNKKLVISEHASINAYNSIFSRMKRIVYPKAYCVSVPNQMDTKEYEKWGCNALYVPHQVTYRATKQNSLDTKILLNVGRLTSDKRQDMLLEVWSEISEKKGWMLWIVGDGEEKMRLEKLIIDLDLCESVRLIPATREINKIYEQASTFVFTSKTEGFGMVLTEAMSFGIPCISFDCPSGPRDVVISNVNGFLIENNDLIRMKEAIQNIISMPQKELDRLGRGAFNTIKDWDNEKILRQWDNIFV